MVFCSANGCRNRSDKKIAGIAFHRFPLKDPKKTRLWVQNMHLANWMPNKNSRLCSKHFSSSKYYIIGTKRCLLDDAVPTVFEELPQYMQAIDQKERDITNTTFVPKMNHDNETISIDLTEDNIDYGEKQHRVQFVNCSDVNKDDSMERPSSQTKPTYFPSFALNSCNKLEDIQPSKKTVQGSPLLDLQKVSTLNFIKTLQKENPHIETVFIDSDEGDNGKMAKSPSVKMQNMVINNSPQRTSRYVDNRFLSNVGNTPKATITSEATTSAKKSPSVWKNEGIPFTVRAISPSRFTEKFINNGSTISIQNEADISSRKFLVIPKEVAPFLVNSQGPITFNVPGLGPLLIPKPSEIFVSQPVPALVQMNKPYQGQEHKKIISKTPVYEHLSDSKYCWRYLQNRKRDLEGFTMIDRFGFYKTEQKRGKMCVLKCYDILKKLQMSIKRKEIAVAAIRSSRLKMENIRLVEIDSIRDERQMGSLHNTHHVKVKMSPIKKENKFPPSIHCVPSIQRFSSESDSQISNDLLVTKKVVFINETAHPRGRKRKKRHGQYINQQTQKRNQSDLESLRSKISYQASSNEKKKNKIKDKCDILQINSKRSGRRRGRPKIKKKTIKDDFLSDTDNLSSKSIRLSGSDIEDIQHKNDKEERKYIFKDSKKHVSPVRYTKRGESSKCSVTDSQKQLSHIKDYNIKPCRVEISHNSLVETAVEKYNDYTFKCIIDLVNTCKIIKDLTEFQNEIQSIKPILVINEDHCASVNFKEVFCKYNIVFPMLEITRFLNLNITNMLFVESAKQGYIKFVHPSVLSRYLAGFREPS